MQMKANKNGVKLLAAIAVFAMVAAALVVAVPAIDAEDEAAPSYVAIETPTGVDVVTSWDKVLETLKTKDKVVLDVYDESESKYISNIVISESATIAEGKTLYIVGKETRDANNNEGSSAFTITVAKDVTLTVAGTIYNNVGSSKDTSDIVNNGTIKFQGSGALYTTCAISNGNKGVDGAFFTSHSTATMGDYKQFFSADAALIAGLAIDSAYGTEKTEVKAMFVYGSATISKNVTAKDVTLVVGGVGEVGTGTSAATVKVMPGITLNIMVSSVEAKASTATLKDVTAGTNGLVLKNGSVVVEGDFVNVEGSTITITAGTAKLVADIPADMTVVIDAGATMQVTKDISNAGVIENKGTVAVAEGKVLTNNGKITNDGVTSYLNGQGKLVNNGTMVNKDSHVDIVTEGTAPAATIAGSTLTLNNYNGTDAFIGEYDTVLLVGENVITLSEKANALVLADAGARIYSVEGTGSLKIVMDVKDVAGDIAAIKVASGVLTIDGVTIDISIAAGTSAKYGSVTAIASAGVEAFSVDIGIDVCPTDISKNAVGISSTGAVNIKSTVLDVTAGYIGIKANNMDIADSDVAAVASTYAIYVVDEDPTKGIINATISSKIDAQAFGSTTGPTAYAIYADALNTASDSVVTVNGMKIGSGTNNATVINSGAMVITGTYTNKAVFTNDGTIGVYGKLENAAGTIDNNGTIIVSANKEVAVSGEIEFSNPTATTVGYVSKVSFSKVEFKADGTAEVTMNITFSATGKADVDITVIGTAVLDGTKLGSVAASFNTDAGVGTISIAQITEKDGASDVKKWQMTSTGTVKFSGTSVAVNNVTKSAAVGGGVTLAQTSNASVSVTGGEFVNDNIVQIDSASSALVNGGTFTNNKDMTVNAAIGIANGKLAGDFIVSKNVVITVGAKGVVDSQVSYSGKYNVTSTTGTKTETDFANTIDLSVTGKNDSFTVKATAPADNTPGSFTFAGLDKLDTDSKVAVIAGNADITTQTIASGVTLEVLAGAVLTLTGQNIVDGVVAAQDGSTIKMMVSTDTSTYGYGTLKYIISFQKGGYTYYCNLAYALSNVDEGMELNINSDAGITTDVSVKKNVTLNIAENVEVTVTAGKKVTMDEGAAFVLAKNATVVIGADSVITGTVRYADNAVVFDTAKVTGTIGTQDATSLVPSAITFTTFVVKDGSVAVNAGNIDGVLTMSVDGTKAATLAIAADAASYVEFVDNAKTVTKLDGKMYIEADSSVKGQISGNGSIVLKDGVTITFVDQAVADVIIGNGTAGFDMVGVSASKIDSTAAATENTFAVKAFVATVTKAAYVSLAGNLYAGEVTVIDNAVLSAVTVQKDAVVTIPAGTTATLDTGASTATGLVKVAGTINMKVADDATTAMYETLNYEIQYTDDSYIVYTCLVTGVNKASAGDSFTISKNLAISSPMTVPEGVTINVADGKYLTVSNGSYISIGKAITTVGATYGITGKIVLAGNAFVIVYNDASVDMSGATIVLGTESNAVAAAKSEFNVLHQLYATTYVNAASVNDSKIAELVQPNIDGYRFVQWLDLNGTKVNLATDIGDKDFDADMKAKQVQVTFQNVEGLKYYVDGNLQAIVGAPIYVDYGSIITAVADSGYTGTPLVNGKAYITVDFDLKTVVGSGVSPAEPVTPVTPVEPEKDDGMGLTDILLIVLVILAAILVIVVAIRMMRS